MSDQITRQQIEAIIAELKAELAERYALASDVADLRRQMESGYGSLDAKLEVLRQLVETNLVGARDMWTQISAGVTILRETQDARNKQINDLDDEVRLLRSNGELLAYAIAGHSESLKLLQAHLIGDEQHPNTPTVYGTLEAMRREFTRELSAQRSAVLGITDRVGSVMLDWRTFQARYEAERKVQKEQEEQELKLRQALWSSLKSMLSKRGLAWMAGIGSALLLLISQAAQILSGLF